MTRLCVTFCIQATCPAWAHPQSYKCSCVKTIGIIFCFVYEHSFALSFSFIFFAMSELKTVSLHVKVGETTLFWKQQALTGLHTGSLCFHVFPAFPMELGSRRVFQDSAYRPALPPHLPWLLAIKSPLSTRYLLCRIIIYQALHLLLMKHNLTTSLTNT